MKDLGVLSPATTNLFKPLDLMPTDRLELSYDGKTNEFNAAISAFLPRADTPGESQRVAASWSARQRFPVRIPERHQVQGDRWTFKATDTTALIIDQTWPAEQIIFTPEAETVYSYLIHRFAHQTQVAKQKALYKEAGLVPTAPPEWIDRSERPLKPFQMCGAITLSAIGSGALFEEMGTGKTPQALSVIFNEARIHHAKTGNPYRALIAAPKNVLSNWRNEVMRFAVCKGRVAVLRGGSLARIKAMIDAMDVEDDDTFVIVIASYETIQRSWQAVSLVPWQRIVADESHMFKSPATKRWKTMLRLRGISEERAVLTGTPIGNTVSDLWTQLEFLGEGMSGFSTFKAFREFYYPFEKKQDGPVERGVKRALSVANMPLLQERLARVSFMVTKKEALPDLPDKVLDVIDCQMSPIQRKCYIKLATELAMEIEADMQRADYGGKQQITVNHVLTKLLRLAQITSGYYVVDATYDEEGEPLCTGDDRIQYFPDCPKLEELVSQVHEMPKGSKAIVWACFIPAIRLISERLTAEGITHVVYTGSTKEDDRRKAEDAFNLDPSIKVFLGNPAAGGVGMNLPGYNADEDGTAFDTNTNADHTFFYVTNWSMIQRAQAEDRNHGQNRNRVQVRVSDLCVPSTIDEEIRVRVLAKKLVALNVQDVRDILNKILHNQTIVEEED